MYKIFKINLLNTYKVNQRTKIKAFKLLGMLDRSGEETTPFLFL